MKEQELIQYFLDTKFNIIKLRPLKEGEIYEITKNNKYNRKQYSDHYGYLSESQEIDMKKFELIEKYDIDNKNKSEYVPNLIKCNLITNTYKVGTDRIRKTKKYCYIESGKIFSIENYEYDKHGRKIYKQSIVLDEDGSIVENLEQYNIVDALISCECENGRLYGISKYHDKKLKEVDYFILVDKNGDIVLKYRDLSTCDIEVDIVNKE